MIGSPGGGGHRRSVTGMTTSPPVHVAPPVVLVAAAVAQTPFTRRHAPTPRSKTLSALVAVASGALAAASVVTLRSYGTTVDASRPDHSTTLVTSGPYGWTRNPVYVALTGTLVARAVRHHSVAAVLPAVGFAVAVDRTQVRLEERALHKRFGKRYDRYAARVPRWLGRRQA